MVLFRWLYNQCDLWSYFAGCIISVIVGEIVFIRYMYNDEVPCQYSHVACSLEHAILFIQISSLCLCGLTLFAAK
jgi:hypothetical protein